MKIKTMIEIYLAAFVLLGIAVLVAACIKHWHLIRDALLEGMGYGLALAGVIAVGAILFAMARRK